MERLRMEQDEREDAEMEDRVQEFVESYEKTERMERWIEAGHSVRRQDFNLAKKEGRLTPEEEKEKLAAFAKTEEYLAAIRKRGPHPTRWELRRDLSGAGVGFRVNQSESD